MQVKYTPLLKLLLENDQWITAAAISDSMGVSLRTIKSYVGDLNQLYPGIIQSSSKGYRVNKEVGLTALKDTQSSIPQTTRERTSYVLNRIIKSETPISLYDLCEELFISPSTLRLIFPRIRHQIEPYRLTLITASDMLSIDGTERSKRRLLSSLLYDESNERFVNLETIQNAFPDIDISVIKTAVLDTLREYRYFINDYSLSNLVLHIAIAVDRIRNHITNITPIAEADAPKLLAHEYTMSQQLADYLEQHLDIKFSAAEVQEMTLILISRTTSLDSQSITVDNLSSFVGEECLSLVYELIDGMQTYFYINISEPEFLVRFALHIKNLLIRAKSEHFSRNPLGNTIKSSCPLIYDYALWCYSVIRERTGISINDDEIGYIAFHFGSALEAQKELASKLSGIIYCPTYYNTDQRFYDVINRRFGSDIMIANIVTEESALNKIVVPDLIISTVPLNQATTTPHVQVYPFLNNSSIEAIRQKIQEVRAAKRKAVFRRYLQQIISPDIFEIGQGFDDHKHAIHTMCGKLFQKGYVGEQFELEVLEREELSSTGFSDFAIPHAIKMNALRTGMYIYISTTPTKWGDSKVSLIILLCINREERFIFQEIFEPLTMILSDHTHLKRIIGTKSYEEFIQYLTDAV